MEHPRDWPLELVVGLREEMAEIRGTARHLESDVAELPHEVRRLDGRLFQLLLAQLATLATVLGTLLSTLAS